MIPFTYYKVQYRGNWHKSRVQSKFCEICAVSFPGQAVPSNTRVLEHTKCLLAQICRNNSWSFEDMGSKCVPTPWRYNSSRVFLEQRRRKMQIFQNVLLCTYNERKDDQQDRRNRAEGHKGRFSDEFTSSRSLGVHGSVIGCDFYDSIEIIFILILFSALADSKSTSTQSCISAIFTPKHQL